jgi:DNA repair protein RAD5
VSLEDLLERFQNSSTDGNQSGQPAGDSNVFGLNVLQRLKSQQLGEEEGDSECTICFESAESAVLMPCMHMACRACVLDYLQVRIVNIALETVFDQTLRTFFLTEKRR